MRVQSLGQEDPLAEEMATHSSILAWRILWTEEPSVLQFMGLQEMDTTEQLTHTHTHTQTQTTLLLIFSSYKEIWHREVK